MLQVKGMDGQQTFVLKMAASDTVGALRRRIQVGSRRWTAPGLVCHNKLPLAGAGSGVSVRDQDCVPTGRLYG